MQLCSSTEQAQQNNCNPIVDEVVIRKTNLQSRQKNTEKSPKKSATSCCNYTFESIQ